MSPCKTLLCISMSTLLAACAVPTTYDEVRAGSGIPVETTTPLPQASAIARLKQAWQHCYIERSLVVSAGTYHVATEEDASHPVVTLRGGRNMLMLMAEFSTAPDGSVRVLTRGFSSSMDRAARNTEAWLKDPMAPSLDMSCR